MALFAEFRRRNVLKVALLYVVASWLILWFIQNTGEVAIRITWFHRASASGERFHFWHARIEG